MLCLARIERGAVHDIRKRSVAPWDRTGGSVPGRSRRAPGGTRALPSPLKSKRRTGWLSGPVVVWEIGARRSVDEHPAKRKSPIPRIKAERRPSPDRFIRKLQRTAAQAAPAQSYAAAPSASQPGEPDDASASRYRHPVDAPFYGLASQSAMAPGMGLHHRLHESRRSSGAAPLAASAYVSDGREEANQRKGWKRRQDSMVIGSGNGTK